MGSTQKPQDDYVLGRDISSRIRLNLQHFMYRKIFGYILNPAIPRKESLKVAEVATGSGIWMLDLMSEFPTSTSYHGFDIDLSQIPPKEWLPHNVSFSKLDLYEELPEELEGSFDIINIRLLLLVVKDNNPGPILRKMFRMLKPGGWLQWTEPSYVGYLDLVKTQPQLTGSAMKALRIKFASRSDNRFQPIWPLNLPEHFKNAGFEDVQADQKSAGESLPWLAFTTDTITAMYQELITNMSPGPEREEYQHLYYQAAQEGRDGTAWNPTRINVIGQKPGMAVPGSS